MKKQIFFLLFVVLQSSIACKAKNNIDEPVKGVWLTNVASDALSSRQKIKETVQVCKAAGINHIFMVTLNQARTTYPSKVMQNLLGVAIQEEFKGRDPLKELIEEAHAENIKVHAWFEFGFSSSYKMQGGPILKAKPNWAAKNSEGKLVEKNGFEWMNAFDPEVQDFVLSLIMEVVNNYDVDGIQGDDRLPANPSTAGYDAYTVTRYKKEHQGLLPPKDYKNADWLTWRANILNDFAGKIYKEVKAAKPDVLVTMAPNIYSWSKEEYLQDWPTWVKNGYVDLIFPQVYRYNFDAYQKTLAAIFDEQLTPAQLKKMYPGLLLSLGDGYLANEKLLNQMIEENRKRGINGEVFFYYEGLKKHPEFFKKYKNL